MVRTSDRITVLVIDDSPHNRRAITQMLETAPDIHVVDRASDGEEGLKKATELHPDVITLDLEMPRLNGFAFLRLLMATAPTPVIVISSYAHKADVFKALELGAYEFIGKPGKTGKEELGHLRAELIEKVRAVRMMKSARKRKVEKAKLWIGAPFVVGIGASTGGPPAIQRILEVVAVEPSASLLICQHMPARFTEAFAERLDRIGAFTVREARGGEEVKPGHAFIAPGGKHMTVAPRPGGGLQLEVQLPATGDRHAPSVDRLFTSMAKALGSRGLGVVLTGMGSDGAAGAVAIHKAGGEVWAESEDSAVIFGMPKEAIATGVVKRILPLDEIGPALLVAAAARKGAPR